MPRIGSADPSQTMEYFQDFKRYADQLTEVARWAARNGWAPATSTNYSVRLPDHAAPAICAITASGVDKEQFDAADVAPVDCDGTPLSGCSLKPSAESLLHLMLYRKPAIGAVLHTHSLAATLLSRQDKAVGYVAFSGWELLKGLAGIDGHEQEVRLPIFSNSQDIVALSAFIEPRLSLTDGGYGFLLSGHGLYVWGQNLAEAKRHLEVFEYLLQCEREVRQHGYHPGAWHPNLSH